MPIHDVAQSAMTRHLLALVSAPRADAALLKNDRSTSFKTRPGRWNCQRPMLIVASCPEWSVTDVLGQIILRVEPRNPALREDMHPWRKRRGFVQ
jgi:hypothetical protein